MRLESMSQSRARSMSRPPRDEMGVKDVTVWFLEILHNLIAQYIDPIHIFENFRKLILKWKKLNLYKLIFNSFFLMK